MSESFEFASGATLHFGPIGCPSEKWTGCDIDLKDIKVTEPNVSNVRVEGESLVGDMHLTPEQARIVHDARLRYYQMGAMHSLVVRPMLTPEEREKLTEEFRRAWEGGEKSEIRLSPPLTPFQMPPADPNAVVQFNRPCPDCNGSGQYIGLNEVETCQTCNGKKVVTT